MHYRNQNRPVLNQSWKDFELIIVDDASTDDSEQIIKSYQERDSKIHAIFHSDNEGIARTVNDGIGKALGEFIAFIASDDVWVTNKLENIYGES
jgi:teichuronic acid biosynthesis glycosyltransferase TuaG